MLKIKSSAQQKTTLPLRLARKTILNKYLKVRKFSLTLCRPLETEDYVIQSMPDVSPTKWHLAHTSWFFEAFLLSKANKKYKSIHPLYNYLFNSYYVLIGERFSRPDRGLLSRPTVKDVFNYRKYVDEYMIDFIENSSDENYEKYAFIIEIGLNHEQQHQELLLTDIKHVLSLNPFHPVYSKNIFKNSKKTAALKWIRFEEGIYEIGTNGKEFCYDNETPLHKDYLTSFYIASRLVTNQEYINFIEDGGYKRQEIWLSDGWATLEKENWSAPLYWQKINNKWYHFTLNGFRKVEPNEPVTHVSHYEADAFARWFGARLPTESEWEVASNKVKIKGNFVENRNFHPLAAEINSKELISQMFGDLWEWTQSAYLPYPGYKPLPGALGEYNGKFMSNQIVLKGGSCATSKTHIRNTYRNFFPPHSRWQFMGIRLAKDNK